MKEKIVILEDDREQPGCLGMALAACGVLGSVLYLLNFTCGMDLFPDNLPVVGNVDEVGATWLLLMCLQYLGLDLLPFARHLSSRRSLGQEQRAAIPGPNDVAR